MLSGIFIDGIPVFLNFLELKNKTDRNGVQRTESPPCDKHFRITCHNFTNHCKFIINDYVKNELLSKSKMRALLLEHGQDL